MSVEPMTRVVFRFDPKTREVIALFPAIAGTMDHATCSAYVHTGQHFSADYGLTVGSTRLAKAPEYAALFAELIRIGYRLKVIRKASRSDWAARYQQTRPTA